MSSVPSRSAATVCSDRPSELHSSMGLNLRGTIVPCHSTAWTSPPRA
uniref:Umc2266 n=1 Tax=Arundo donax TaxID=35708 RepID=A0A0A9H422_ARUDO